MAIRRNLPAAAFLALFSMAGASVCLAAPAAEDTGPGTPVGTTPTTLEANPVSGSLYERLGGTATMTAVISDTLDRVSSDPHMNQSFDRVNLKRVKAVLLQKICSITGGGCIYTGDTIREIHAGHQITNAEFYGMVEVLRDSMRKHGVPLGARNELLALLAPMKRDVVER